MFCSPIRGDAAHDGKIVGMGSAQSRSTSAGSAPSEGRSSADLQKSPELMPKEYHNGADGLPEYDYPTPWSVKTEPNYPVPLVVKNTFVGFDIWQPPSLEGFYDERKTQSCPASGIGLPPGLRGPVECDQASFVAAAKLVAAEVAHHRNDIMADIGESKAAQQQMEHLLPSGLLDDIPLPDDQSQATAFHLHSTEASGQAKPALVLDLMQALSPPDIATSHFDVIMSELQKHKFAPPFAASQGGHTMQPPQLFPNHLMTPGLAFSSVADTRIDMNVPSPQPIQPIVVCSDQCPTVGSQGHWLGTCKPCAFLHTKGCGNGASCQFCHLCDKGEKKRRAKDKRGVQRVCD